MVVQLSCFSFRDVSGVEELEDLWLCRNQPHEAGTNELSPRVFLPW